MRDGGEGGTSKNTWSLDERSEPYLLTAVTPGGLTVLHCPLGLTPHAGRLSESMVASPICREGSPYKRGTLGAYIGGNNCFSSLFLKEGVKSLLLM